MAERLPKVLVQRFINLAEDDNCRLICTFTPRALNALLTRAGVEQASDLPVVRLRELCARASSAAALRCLIERPGAEAEIPDGSRGVMIQTHIGFQPEQEAGVVSALAADPVAVSDTVDALYDSRFTTIDLELRIFDGPLAEPDLDWEHAGSTLLQCIIESPLIASDT